MTDHLDPVSVSLYLRGAGSPGERSAWENHLAECADCRQELVEAGRLVATIPVRRRLPLLPAAAAAAAVVLVWFGTIHRQPTAPVTRDPEPVAGLAPRPLAPVGEVSAARGLLWAAVAGAARYRVTLFTAEGEAAWEATVTDTSVNLPDSLQLPVATAQYWQVRAETGYGRWVESELVAFTIRGKDAPR